MMLTTERWGPLCSAADDYDIATREVSLTKERARKASEALHGQILKLTKTQPVHSQQAPVIRTGVLVTLSTSCGDAGDGSK